MSEGEQTQHGQSATIVSTSPLRHVEVRQRKRRQQQFWSLRTSKMSEQATVSRRRQSIGQDDLTEAYMQLKRLRELVSEAENSASNVNAAPIVREISPLPNT